MSRIIIRRLPKICFISLLFSVVLLGAFSCMLTGEADFLEGLLEKTDSFGGEMTFVTKDGETVKITITNVTQPDVSESVDENVNECEDEPGEKKSPDSPSLSDILPSLDSIEDVFINLGVWEKATELRKRVPEVVTTNQNGLERLL